MGNVGAAPFLERENALGTLRDIIIGAREGSGRVVVVSGEAGIGKTTLVRRFTEGLSGDVRVLWGACDDLTVPEPLGPLREIAGQVGGGFAQVVEGHESREVGRALRAELARDMPCVCVIEDCHWADEATLDVLAYAARRTRGLPSVLLVTFRDDELSGTHRLRQVIGSVPPDDLIRLPLAPLSRAAVGEIAGADADLEALYAITAGNPFLVTETLAAGTDRVPPTVRDTVLARAARLSAAARGVLEVVSVVPTRAELWLVQAHSGTAAAIDECERSGLLVVEERTLRYRHELARRAYRESLSALRRIELNRKVLRILEDSGQELARLVHHAEAAQDHDALTRYALVAARRAAETRSHREAVALFTRALRHPDRLDPADRAAAYEALSDAAGTNNQLGPAVEARQSALALRRELGDPQKVGVNLIRLSRLHWWAGRRRAAEESAAEAVTLLEGHGPSRELAMAYGNRAALLMLVQHNREAIAVGERAMALAREVGDTETLLHAQTTVGSARMFDDPDGGRELLRQVGEQALAAHLDEAVCRAFHNIAATDVDHCRLDRAETEIEHALTVARRLEHRRFEVETLGVRAVRDLMMGRWQSAVAIVDDLFALHELSGVTHGQVLRVLATVELRRGGRQAHALVEEAWRLARPAEELQWTRPTAALRAEAAWLSGDVDGVHEATREIYPIALEYGHPWEVGDLALWRWRSGLLDGVPANCAEPHTLAIDGDWEGAARAWERIGMPYERALALCDAPEPEPVLAGLGLLDELGAVAPARVVRRKLHALGVRGVPRGPRPATRAHPAGLSTRQAEVLTLITGGLSNAEIAKAMFLTPKTVEHHVSAILRKLRVDSRAEAAEAARTLGLATAQPGGAGSPG
ncbi:regulatory protein, luxR family [Thermomonospora echinospora]|uniref:Regulatory protein, luxR family n=1 Tax=Thermomonospora echinospora TaxID=1992 RepID=A0A1H6DT91_9ACTN|nr:AAA family ATPase [Thermomonospora echinospora]SEG88450.1 regulatory protein, luxR family [Thermomonospora echinospora]